MSAVIQAILSFVAGSMGKSGGVPGAVSGVSKIAALTPLAMLAIAHKDEIAVTLTYGELAVVGGAAYFILELVHRSRPPSSGPQE